MNKITVAKELLKIAKSLVSGIECEKCHKKENLVENNHPRSKYKVLCKNCIEQFLPKNSADRIMFDRLPVSK